MSQIQNYNQQCNFPVIPKYDFPNRLVPKYGRGPAYMWGNPFCSSVNSEQKKTQVDSIGPKMKIKRTNTPKRSNESNPSPVLSGRERKGSSVCRTALRDTEILQRELNEKNKPYLMFSKIQNAKSEEGRIDFINRYQATYPENLESRLLQETPNEAQGLIRSLFQPNEVIMVHALHSALEKDIGGIELSLVEILFLSSHEQKQRYAQLYTQLYPGTSLQQDITNNTDHSVQKLCLALLQNELKEMEIDGLAHAQKDVNDLTEAIKSDRVDIIIEILTTNCIDQLTLFNQEFDKINAEKLSKFISNGIPKKDRFGDVFHSALKRIISLIEDPIKCKAEKLTQMLKYLETQMSPHAIQGLDVIRRKEVIHRMFIVDKQEMGEIAKKIEEMKGIALETLIQSIQEVKYRNMLATFVRDNDW